MLNSGGRLNGCNEGHDGRLKSTHKRADEVFITSTTRGLLPVLSIEGRPMRQSGETLVRLQEAFRRYVDDYVARERGIPLTAGGEH